MIQWGVDGVAMKWVVMFFIFIIMGCFVKPARVLNIIKLIIQTINSDSVYTNVVWDASTLLLCLMQLRIHMLWLQVSSYLQFNFDAFSPWGTLNDSNWGMFSWYFAVLMRKIALSVRQSIIITACLFMNTTVPSLYPIQGLEQMWKRHSENTQKLCSGIEEMGLELFIKDPVSSGAIII